MGKGKGIQGKEGKGKRRKEGSRKKTGKSKKGIRETEREREGESATQQVMPACLSLSENWALRCIRQNKATWAECCVSRVYACSEVYLFCGRDREGPVQHRGKRESV